MRRRLTMWMAGLVVALLAPLVGMVPVSAAAPSLAGASSRFSGFEAEGGGWQSHPLTVSEPGRLTVELTWSDPATNLQLFLVGEDGVVASAATQDRSETLIYDAEPGRYEVAVVAREGASAYAVSVDVAGRDFVTLLDTEGTATGDERAAGHRFTVAERTRVEVLLKWNGESDLGLAVVGSDGVLGTSQTDEQPEILMLTLDPGTYRAVAGVIQGADTPYQLRVIELADARGERNQASGAEGRPDVDSGPVFTGGEAPGGGWSAHSVEVSGSRRLEIGMSWANPAADLRLFLADENGVIELGSGSGRLERIEVVVPAGTYRVAALAARGASNYRIEVAASSASRPGVVGATPPTTAPPSTAPPSTAPPANTPPPATPPPTTPPRRPGVGGAGAAGEVAQRWAPVNLAGPAARELSEAEAVALARSTDSMTVTPGALDRHLAAMRRANPDLEVLVYMNAAYAYAAEEHKYPASWYARDRSGAKIRSNGWQNWLMDPTNPGWVASRVATCQEQSGDRYDGCFLDMLGAAPVYPSYGTGVPINARTGRPYTAVEWHRATGEIARRVVAGNPSLTVWGNGAANGVRYYADHLRSDLVVEPIDASIAELWLRAARDPIGAFPSEAEWRRDVDMLAHAEARGGAIFTLTKIGVGASQAQIDQWHRFAAASFLLGAQGDSRFAFTGNERVDPVRTSPREFPDLGSARGAYRQVGEVYVREFARGLAVVNPTGSPASFSLDGTYLDEGRTVSGTLRLGAHEGAVLVRR